jgi:hypothetical protein
MVVALDLFHDQHYPLGFELTVGESRCTKHFDSGYLEVIEVVAVMDATLPVRFLITDTNGDFMFTGNDGG